MLNKMKILMVAFLATAFLLTSCDEETDDDGDTTLVLPSAPTELMATSIDSTTIHIKWTASENEADSNWVGYVINVSDQAGNVIMDMESISGHTSGDPYPVEDLTAGEIYTVELYAQNSDGNSTQAATIMWSPAIRFSSAPDGVSDIALHERASSLGSGLDIYFYDTDFDEKGTASKSVSEREEWNLALDTDNGLIIGSGSQLYVNDPTGNPRPMPTETTEISGPIEAESLNDVFDSEGLDSKNFSETTFDLNNYQSNIVIYVKVSEGADEYYAKVLLKRGDNGWLQGTAPDRYVAAEISFQERTGVPYAETISNSGNTK